MATKKVRIALEIAPNGDWQAHGSNLNDETDWDETMSVIEDCLDGHHVQRHWITAEVPIPEDNAGEIVGEAAPAQSEAA